MVQKESLLWSRSKKGPLASLSRAHILFSYAHGAIRLVECRNYPSTRPLSFHSISPMFEVTGPRDSSRKDKRPVVINSLSPFKLFASLPLNFLALALRFVYLLIFFKLSKIPNLSPIYLKTLNHVRSRWFLAECSPRLSMMKAKFLVLLSIVIALSLIHIWRCRRRG